MIYNVSGESISDVYSVEGENLNIAYDIEGTAISGEPTPEPHGIEVYENYEISAMPYNAPSGLQGFDYYDGKLVMCVGDNYLRVFDAETGTALGSKSSADIRHANSLVFSDEFYDESDTLPLICGTYGGQSYLTYHRISNSFDSVELVKEYKLQVTREPNTVWYGFGFDNGYLYAIGYTSGAHAYSSTNYIQLAKFDLQNPIDNGDDSYTLPVVHQVRRAWFECIQGSNVHDGYFWVTSGVSSPAHLYAIDLETAEILLDITAENDEWNHEVEGCAWENDYTIIFGLKEYCGMFKVTFPDLMPETEQT